MNREDNELTLGQLFKVVKKSFKRAVIYVLVSVIIATALLLVVRSFTGTKTYASRISFSTPDKATTQKMSDAKSSIVSKALKNNGKTDTDDITKIIAGLSITPYIPEMDEEKLENYIPTSFTVSIRPSNKLDYNDAEYISLLDSISQGYVKLYASTIFPNVNADYILNEGAEFFQSATDIYTKATLLHDTLDSFINNNPLLEDYQNANGKTATIIVNELKILLNNIEAYRNDIITNGYSENLTELKKAYDVTTKSLQSKLTTAQNKLEQAKLNLKENFPAIEILPSDGSSSGSTISNISTEMYKTYMSLTQEVIKYTAEQESYREQLESIGTLPNVIVETDDTTKQALRDEISVYSATLENISNNYKLLRSYNNNPYLTSDASITIQATLVTNNIISILVFIIIIALVALIAYLVAYMQVFNKMKKNGTLYDEEKDFINKEESDESVSF